VSVENNFKIEIVEISETKIIFKSNNPWAICLNAANEEKAQHYFLTKNNLNLLKLKKVLAKDFSFPIKETKLQTSSLKLRPYQIEDVKFLSRLKSMAIFNEMRTGKTPTALATYYHLPVNNLIIISPSILQQQWQNSIEEWLNKPAYIISYLPSETRKIFYQRFCQEKDWVIIVSKDIFKTDSSFFKICRKKTNKQPYCTIVDEVHFLRNYQSQQSKSIYCLKDANYKMALTGTPTVNHYTDIFGILKFLQPEKYTSYWKFAEHFFTIQKTEFTSRQGQTFILKKVLSFKDEKAHQELQTILNQISVSRKQKEVLPWLPAIIYSQEDLVMEEEQQALYFRWVKKRESNYYPLEFLAKLKTLTLYPPALGIKTWGSKVNFLVEYCQENEQNSILIFSTRSETFLEPLAKIFQEKKNKVGLITGKISFSERKEFIQQFQEKKISLLLCNIQSAGTGLNLSQADTIIFADRSYSPADNEQAEARFLPTNASENPKVRLVIDLVCKNTIDEKILNLLKRKENITKIIQNDPDYFFR